MTAEFIAYSGFSALLLALGVARANESFASERERMVREQIEGRGIRNRDILRVMRATPRHLFVPKAFQALAYDDYPVPVGFGATISQPYIVAVMMELLEPSKQHRVLEIGTGSGYQAALLSQLVTCVYTIEIVPELAETAGKRLSDLGYSNVVVRQGDGYDGWSGQAPFDRIIITAAPPEIPKALIEQLKPGGRLVAPIGSGPMQQLVVLDKKPDGSLHRSFGPMVTFVPMRSVHN
ncbi:MAG TPA: protein-L-isoaspartate(D-aspartate) O-methyltransferase [Bryobacteraceae bacterium]|nr:protein-L-isoaspartate(D-aspartate) O-methyltransferase [Bryobacteraceae bacterium]